MAVEYIKPQETLQARAFQITINKVIPDEPHLVFSYTNDKQDLGNKIITPTEIVEQGIATIEEVTYCEEVLRKIADSISPVVE